MACKTFSHIFVSGKLKNPEIWEFVEVIAILKANKPPEDPKSAVYNLLERIHFRKFTLITIKGPPMNRQVSGQNAVAVIKCLHKKLYIDR